MNTKKLTETHERIGNEYLDTMKKRGVDFPPPVAWTTSPSGRTSAVIFFDDDDEEEVNGFPLDMIVSVVVIRVLARSVTGRN